jgi:hypothetical protein
LDYLKAPGAVRRGETISRQELIQYFANYAGGIHLDRNKKTPGKKRPNYDLIAELERNVQADTMDGLYYALLSIGQAVGRSNDLLELAAKIRNDST